MHWLIHWRWNETSLNLHPMTRDTLKNWNIHHCPIALWRNNVSYRMNCIIIIRMSAQYTRTHAVKWVKTSNNSKTKIILNWMPFRVKTWLCCALCVSVYLYVWSYNCVCARGCLLLMLLMLKISSFCAKSMLQMAHKWYLCVILTRD